MRYWSVYLCLLLHHFRGDFAEGAPQSGEKGCRFSLQFDESIRSLIKASNKPCYIPPPSREVCTALYSEIGSCERSVTTVTRQPVCKGALIFEDNFNTLDLNVWTKEVRIPMEDEGLPFVSYQNRSENCLVNDGKLHITPTMLSDNPGFDESMIRRGVLQLEDCKPNEELSQECEKRAKFSQILPPIVSARINTRRSFSFRYGKVKIRAKLPQGDWLFPLITLDPVEHYYGSKNYASGQMIVALTRGNINLDAPKYKYMSNKYLFGGTLIPYRTFLGNQGLTQTKFKEDLGKDFHDYTLTWTETEIRLGIDDVEYGTVLTRFGEDHLKDHTDLLRYIKLWNNGNSSGPFDREFYLTLGVAAGGHLHFPEAATGEILKPWKNGDPKAMLQFWKNRGKWKKTWKGDDTGLQVEYVQVFAL